MMRAEWRAWRASFRETRSGMVLVFFLGVVMAAGQAPLGLSYLAFAGLVAIFVQAECVQAPRDSAWLGWAAGSGYFAAGLFWIVEPFFVDPVRHGWMAPFALILLPGGLALFWGLAFGLAARFGQGWRRLFLLATLLAAVEMSRAFVFTGFPWALIGYMWIGSAQMQLAALIGPHGLTLVTTLLAALAAIWAKRSRLWLVAPAVAVLVLAGTGLWGVKRATTPLPDRADPVVLRIVQPNAEQHLKWNPGMAEFFFNRLLTHTATAPEGPAPDAVIWPETAVQYLLSEDDGVLQAIDQASGGRPVAFGVVRRDGARVYNSLAVTGEGGRIDQLYDKFHLTPFGEYMPFGDLLARFGINGLAASAGQGFSAGAGPQVLRFAGLALPLICYEAIFPQNLRTAQRPDWLLHITNDAWFGKISGPYQHLAQAQMRAVEQGLPMARAANTGISAMIDPYGRVVGMLPLGVDGFIDAALPVALPATPYARYGDWPVLALLIALSLIFTLRSSPKPD